MYRVELKVALGETSPASLIFVVPNVPCGVESIEPSREVEGERRVPNVPCGVERAATFAAFPRERGFLMYRVELKVRQTKTDQSLQVYMFLMYRVELKVLQLQQKSLLKVGVPNVPCGVERHSTEPYQMFDPSGS